MAESIPFVDFVAAVHDLHPETAIVLGSGMGKIAGRLRVRHTLPYGQVPGLASASVAGHRGQLTLGDWAGRQVMIFEGRLHYYESGDWSLVVAPLHLAKSLGVKTVILTNAAGGIRADLYPGNLLAIRGHIDWTGPYCWRPFILPSPLGGAPVATGSGVRGPYSARFRHLLEQAANHKGILLTEGIYAAVTGPSYETPAEIRALRAWGADAVGMSTAREAQAAFDLGLECAALSLITNRAAGLGTAPINHAEVLAAAAAAAERLADLLEAFLQLSA
jgi:purine-nucleoside phosphorylase